jgi:hypothetical protein
MDTQCAADCPSAGFWFRLDDRIAGSKAWYFPIIFMFCEVKVVLSMVALIAGFYMIKMI